MKVWVCAMVLPCHLDIVEKGKMQKVDCCTKLSFYAICKSRPAMMEWVASRKSHVGGEWKVDVIARDFYQIFNDRGYAIQATELVIQ